MLQNLRIYRGPEFTEEPSVPRDTSIRVALGDVVHLLADAVESRRTWLRDFSHEEIELSHDLYEVLMAYKHFRRPSA